MIKITVQVEGMQCGMCEAHINDAIRKAFPVKKVTSSHTRKQTILFTQEDIAEEQLKAVLDQVGYTFISCTKEPYEKKRSLFSFRK